MISDINLIPTRPFNFRVIDDTLSASALPYLSGPNWLKQHGISDVVNFRTERDIIGNASEAKKMTDLGIKLHRIPSITAKPTEENVFKFLKLTQDIKAKNGKLHAHCVQGANRTGMYVFIYELLNNIRTPKESFFELITHGFNKEKYSHLINWMCNFVQKMHK